MTSVGSSKKAQHSISSESQRFCPMHCMAIWCHQDGVQSRPHVATAEINNVWHMVAKRLACFLPRCLPHLAMCPSQNDKCRSALLLGLLCSTEYHTWPATTTGIIMNLIAVQHTLQHGTIERPDDGQNLYRHTCGFHDAGPSAQATCLLAQPKAAEDSCGTYLHM